jgi:TonB family protein
MRATLMAALLVWTVNVQADIYRANEAAAKADLARAFELYRELAELGHPLAQETLAAMYVNGEGVKRDNVLGYAWAKLALENGATGPSRSIVEQLEPHLKGASRERIAEVHGQFGGEALKRRLLPLPWVPKAEDTSTTRCRMRAPANPDDFYPPEARQKRVSGMVLVDVKVLPDGSVRQPRVLYSFPPGAFDAPGRAIALRSGYSPAIENGVRMPCTMRFKVKFKHQGGPEPFTDDKSIRMIAELRTSAAAGDARSQFLYGLIMAVRPAPDPDWETTDRWMLRAAQAGLPGAQYMIGVTPISGYRGKDEAAKGARWLELASNRGSGDASTALAVHLLAAEDAATRARGFTWMQRAAESGHFEGRLFFAALLASWPEVERRDPGRALAVLDELGREFDYDPLSFEIRAAALAGQGNFEDAIHVQSRAVNLARRYDWDASALQARLDAYREKRMAGGELVSF